MRGLAPPAAIASLSPAHIHNAEQMRGFSVCFVDCADSAAVECTQRLRRACGDELYLVGVAGVASPEFQSAIFDAGADDLLLDDGPLNLLRCLLRARRHLSMLHTLARERDALHETLGTWQDGLDHLPTPIYFKDLAGRYLVCNTAFTRFVGAGREQVIGQTLADLLPKDVAELHRQSDVQVMRQTGVLRVETDVCVPDTGMRHILLHKASVATPEGGLRGIAGVVIDITERKELEARLTAAAERDPLTNAYNRRKFFELAAAAMEQVSAGDRRFAVAVIDVDNFKSINDELGHGEGDLTLCSIVDTMNTYEEEGVFVARAGGEEFFAFFSGNSAARAGEILEAMRRDIERYCHVSTGAGAAGTISVGFTDFDPRYETIDHALKRADLALYRAKSGGRNKLSEAEQADRGW